MSQIELRLDPENPAQFFACCGLFELATLLSETNGQPGVEAAFDYDRRQPRNALFRLHRSPKSLSELIQFLKAAEASTAEASDKAPVALKFSERTELTLDWWLMPNRAEKSDLKLWAGRQQTLRNLVKPMQEEIPDVCGPSLLEESAPMKGRFGLDPRSSWNTLDFGSSPDAQDAKVSTFAATEILAAVGLQGFRPFRREHRNVYGYRLWATPLPSVVARAAVQEVFPTPGQSFSFSIEKRSGAYSYFAYAQPTQGA